MKPEPLYGIRGRLEKGAEKLVWYSLWLSSPGEAALPVGLIPTLGRRVRPRHKGDRDGR